MTDEELEHRLTAVENRAQSNTHRLDELGKLTDAVNGMNTNIKLTIQQLENTNKSLEIVTAQNKKQEDRLTAFQFPVHRGRVNPQPVCDFLYSQPIFQPLFNTDSVCKRKLFEHSHAVFLLSTMAFYFRF